MKEVNPKEVKDQVVQWIRDWFEQNGPGCNAVIGISGGKDSSIVAGLCVEALGKDRVIGITMPNGVQKDISDSMKLINHLGIRYFNVNIGETYKALMGEVEKELGSQNIEVSNQTVINMPPRLRMTTLFAARATRTTSASPMPFWTNTSVQAFVKILSSRQRSTTST